MKGIFGLDLSLKHWGLVELNEDGQVRNYWFMTDTRKYADADPIHGLYYKAPADLDVESENFRRVRLIKKYLGDRLGLGTEPGTSYGLASAHVAVEAYGYATMSPKFAEIAEQTGIIKNWMLEEGAQIRLHDPDSVKLFGATNGHALKKDMVLAMIGSMPDRPGKDRASFFPSDLIKPIHKKIGLKNPKVVNDYDGPGTDLADAYWLAQLLRTEMMLRQGKITLANLSESQIRVFNRVTKAFPVNLLDRPFAKYVSC